MTKNQHYLYSFWNKKKLPLLNVNPYWTNWLFLYDSNQINNLTFVNEAAVTWWYQQRELSTYHSDPDSTEEHFDSVLKTNWMFVCQSDIYERWTYQAGNPSRLFSTNLWKCRLAMMKATLCWPYKHFKINYSILERIQNAPETPHTSGWV